MYELDSFWSKVEFTDTCFEWKAGKRGTGYGYKRVKGRARSAHKIVWEMFYGPVPEEHEICHSCDNRKCVNPFHLFIGTHQENMDDAAKKGRLPGGSGPRFHKRKLKEPELNELFRLLDQGVPMRRIAKQFDVSQPFVSYLKNGKRYKVGN